jgi:hypothetical protein
MDVSSARLDYLRDAGHGEWQYLKSYQSPSGW